MNTTCLTSRETVPRPSCGATAAAETDGDSVKHCGTLYQRLNDSTLPVNDSLDLLISTSISFGQPSVKAGGASA